MEPSLRARPARPLAAAGSALALGALGVIAPAALFAAPAQAQVLSTTPYAPKPDPAIERLQLRVDTLEADLRKATGRVEQLTFDLTQARKAADDANAARMRAERALDALTQRVAALEALARGEPPPEIPASGREAVGPLVGPTGASTREAQAAARGTDGAIATAASFDPAQLPDTEPELMREARNLLLRGDYASAEIAFRHFLEKFPKSETASEAQYLLGESRLIQEAYPEAAESYVKLLSTYPKSTRAPDGMVKLARTLRLMGEKKQACAALADLPNRYPKASAVTRSLAATEKQRAGC